MSIQHTTMTPRLSLSVPKNMRDGLYQAQLHGIVAGAVIEKGVVIAVAPIMVNKWWMWVHHLKRIGD